MAQHIAKYPRGLTGIKLVAGIATATGTRPPPKRGVCDANAGCNRYRILLMVLPCTKVPTTAPVA